MLADQPKRIGSLDYSRCNCPCIGREGTDLTYRGSEVDETERTDHDDYSADEDVCPWTRRRPFTGYIERFGKTTHNVI